MTRGGVTNSGGFRRIVAGVAITVGLVLFVLPSIVDVFALVSGGFDTQTSEGVEVIEDVVLNWWVPLALSNPYVFLVVAVILAVIGAEEVVEM